MKKQVKIAITVVVALVVLALIFLMISNSQKNKSGQTGTTGTVPKEMLQNQTPEAAKATQALVNEVTQDIKKPVETINVAPTKNADGSISTTTATIQVVTVANGTSPINIATGKVVTKTGEVATNNVAPGIGNAPTESFPITSTTALPKSTIKLAVTSSSFTPKEFTVNRGQAVSLAITNANETTYSEVFRFDDPSLSAVAIGLAKGETKTISFNAPDKAGSYVFYSSMFDHRAQGAVGTMIVK